MLRMNHHLAYSLVHEGSHYYLRFAKDVTFLQKVSLKKSLARIPDGSSVFIDGGGAMFIDYDIREIVDDFSRSSAARGIDLNVRNFPLRRDELFGTCRDKEVS